MPEPSLPALEITKSGIAILILGTTLTAAWLATRALHRRGLMNPGIAGWFAVVEASAIGAALSLTGMLPFFGIAVSGPALKRSLGSGADPRALSPLMGAIVIAAHNLSSASPYSRETFAQAALAMAVPLIFRRPPLPEIEPEVVVERIEATVETDEGLRERFRALREHAQGLERKGWRDRLVVRLLDEWGGASPSLESGWAETIRASLAAPGLLLWVRGKAACAGEVPKEWRETGSLPDPQSATVERGVAEYFGHRAVHAQASLADGGQVVLFVPVVGNGPPVLRGQLSRAAAALAKAAMPAMMSIATVSEAVGPAAAIELGSEQVPEPDAAIAWLSVLRRKWRADCVAILDREGATEVQVGRSVDWSLLEPSAFQAGPRYAAEGQAPWIVAGKALRSGVGSVALAPTGDGRWIVCAGRGPGSISATAYQELVESAGELSGASTAHGRVVDSSTFADRIALGGHVMLTLTVQEGEAPLSQRVAEALPAGSLVSVRPGVGLMVAIPDERTAGAWASSQAASEIEAEAGTRWRSATVPAA